MRVFDSTTPEGVAFWYVQQNVGSNYQISKVELEKENVKVIFDGVFRGRCPTCGRQIEEKVDAVLSVAVRKRDLKIVEKPDLSELRKKVVEAGLEFLLRR